MKRLAALFAVLALIASGADTPAGAKPADWTPVRATLALAPVGADGTALLTLELAIESPWYVYTKSSRSQELHLGLELPSVVAPAADWVRPKPRVVYQDERAEVLSGSVRFQRPLQIAAAPTGDAVITVTVLFQACDPTVCRPPEEVRVSVKLPGLPAGK
jgi:hypothetical protein